MRRNGFGKLPEVGEPRDGPTKLETWWTWFPDLGNIPMAIPLDGWLSEKVESQAKVSKVPKESQK